MQWKDFVITGTALAAGLAAERFDQNVRNDFFAGFAGDAAAREGALNKAEQALAADPKHAEALVWRGAGLQAKGGQAFRDNDRDTGMRFMAQGTGEMVSGSAYARRAAEWLEKATVSRTGCIGCHTQQSR